MVPLIKKLNCVFISICMLMAIFGFALSAGAMDTFTSETTDAKKLSLVSGKSIVLRSAIPVKRVSIANPEIADLILISPKEIYITGKTAGTTNLTFWQNKEIVAIFDLNVEYDVAVLKQKMYQILPMEKDLRVISTNDSITLAGKISTTTKLSQALALASAYAPKGKVQNMLQVGGVHQVMLEVRVAEISKSTMKRLGVNFAYTGSSGEFGISLLSGLAGIADAGSGGLPGAIGLDLSPAVNALFRFNYGAATWTWLIDALEEDGLVKILAEPTLITLSGQPANFLAGGEFPVPVPQGLGTVAIEYKTFGVGLSFTPMVLSEDKINIQVTPEVSELDFSTAIRLEGFTTPGISTRRASTTVELGDGQSFAIAGLLRDSVRSGISKYPLLGDIPIIGVLFQSKEFQRNETELVIIVTPHLVKPMDIAKQSLPTDFYVPPNDTEFYLLGLLEGRTKGGTAITAGSLDGTFGHTIPEE